MNYKNFIIKMPIVRVLPNGQTMREIDVIAKEERLSVHLNGQKIISTMCLLNSQDCYAIGFLMSEGVIENINDIRHVRVSEDGLNVFVDSKINDSNMSNLYHEKTLTSGCCVGVSANFSGKIMHKFVSSKMRVNLTQLRAHIEHFERESEMFAQTGCVHKVMLFCDGNIFESEDIGRHNALDKVLGKAQLARADMKKGVLIVSGRLSMEMVIKCAMHDVPLVISRAATTALGIKSAQNLGITLVGFARNGAMNIYTHANRIILDSQSNLA